MRVRRAIAIIGAIFLPGFGHFALGHRRRALFWGLGFYVLIPLVVFGTLFRLSWLAFLGVIAAVVAWAVMLAEVIRRPESLDRMPRWPVLVGVAVLLLLVQAGIGEFRTYHSQASRFRPEVWSLPFSSVITSMQTSSLTDLESRAGVTSSYSDILKTRDEYS